MTVKREVFNKRKGIISLSISFLVFTNLLIDSEPTYAIKNQKIAQEYNSDEVIVKYKSAASETSLKTLSKELDLSTKGSLSISEDIELVEISSNENVVDVVEELEDSGLVEWAQPNYIYTLDTTPPDSYWPYQWGAHNTGQVVNGSSGLNDVDIDAIEGWAKQSSKNQVVVAIIDSGLDINHPDLKGQIWQNSAEASGIPGIDDDRNGYVDDVNGWDFYNDDHTVFDSATEDGHSTHVAGIIAGTHNDIGIRGVATNVKIMPLKFIGPDGSGSTMDAIYAIEYAASMGVKVINASWGGETGTYDEALNEAIAASDTVFIAAAGNGGTDGIGDNNDINPIAPASLSATNIISVAAVDQKGKLASFSNYGANSVDVAAPGVNIVSTYPNNEYTMMNGTSMATPFVTGIVANLLSENINRPQSEVITLIKNSGLALPDLANRTVSGKLVNLNEALQSTSKETLPVKGYIDRPSNKASVSGVVKVGGWALNNDGVEKVEILVDGVVHGLANYGLKRSDVLHAFPKYQNEFSGYEYSLDTSTISSGNHTITVKTTSKTGQQNFIGGSRIIKVVTLPVKGYYDAPHNESTVTGMTKIKGWFLDADGVNKLEVLVDGKVVGEVTYGKKRSDVLAVFPEYQNEYAGYEYMLDTSKLSNGKHTIAIRETSNKGIKTTLDSRTIFVASLLAKGYVDAPYDNQSVNGSVKVIGWFLDGNGVKKLEVLVDGVVHGEATYGIKRSDVFAAYPSYNNEYSGYEYVLDTAYLTRGIHTIEVKATSVSGIQSTLSARKIIVKGSLPIKGYLDSPDNGLTVKSPFKVKGWYLDPNGVSKIEVLVDGVLYGYATYGLKRSDVFKVFHEYNNEYAGYEYIINPSTLSSGKHQVDVKITSQSGAQLKLGSRMIDVASLAPKGYLDAPKPNSSLSGTIQVKGWFLDVHGVSKIEVLIDGAVHGQANYGLERSDVLNVFPQYKNEYSGYEYMLDTSTLSEGTHSITVREVSNNGIQTELFEKPITVSH